jgi:hypothetical protein
MNNLDAVREAIADVLRPGHFFAASVLQLEWDHQPREETLWEVYRGRLSARQLSRETAVFESWSIFLRQDGERSGEPLLSLKLDAELGLLHVVRGLLCWTWEGYHAGGNVYQSREVERWLRELVGSIDVASRERKLPEKAQPENSENVALASRGRKPPEKAQPEKAQPENDEHATLRAELALWLFRAVVGLSRLPLASIEAPLPAFTLGEFAYFYNPDSPNDKSRSLTSWRQLLTHYREGWPFAVRTKWLEFLLRAPPAHDITELAAACVQQWHARHQETGDTLALLRAVFNDVALSPYTNFVDKALALLRQLVERHYFTIEQHVDFLSYLLRQLARHLTAYDLVTFHHRGANYPDALLLDAALKEYLRIVERQPALFDGDTRPARLRRRALRLAWLHRRRYEGHPVPDAPTSPGENMRVLPPPHVRVPEEQILNLAKRKKRLYKDDPLPKHIGPHGERVLKWCGRDLQSVDEVRELGMAVFIERPLGMVKAPGEPDLSPLLSHEAFSRSLAGRALGELARDPLLGLSADEIGRCREVLASAWPSGGIAANTLPTDPPRVVALADAAKAANDFVILRTLPGSLAALSEWFDLPAALHEHGIDFNLERRGWLVVCNVTATGKPAMLICNASGQRVLELELNATQGIDAR